MGLPNASYKTNPTRVLRPRVWLISACGPAQRDGDHRSFHRGQPRPSDEVGQGIGHIVGEGQVLSQSGGLQRQIGGPGVADQP
jgi:hypothetical protein